MSDIHKLQDLAPSHMTRMPHAHAASNSSDQHHSNTETIEQHGFVLFNTGVSGGNLLMGSLVNSSEILECIT